MGLIPWGPHISERIPLQQLQRRFVQKTILGDDAVCGVGALAILIGLESREEAERGRVKWHDEREDTVADWLSR